MKYEKEVSMVPEIWIMIGILDAIVRKGILLTDVLDKSLDYLVQIYHATSDKRILDTAILQIKAFLYMGGDYAVLCDKFDAVIKQIGISREQIMLQYSAKKVGLTRGQVREMIGRWMPSKNNPMKIQDVVDDIIKKVSLHETGRYLYQYKRKDGKWEELDQYELVIESDYAYFHDIGKMRYYVLEQGENMYDKDCCIR